MRLNKLALFAVSAAVFVFSACGTTETAANKTAINNSNAASAAANQTNANRTNLNTPTNSNGNAVASKIQNSATAKDNAEADEISGELQVGKTDSVILYVGMESGDYAAYCFPNDSEAGRAILAACKNKEQCEVKGKIDHEAGCTVPGLEADLSDKGKILKVERARKSARK